MREYLEAIEKDELRAEYLELPVAVKAEVQAKEEVVMSEADMLRYEYLGLIDSEYNMSVEIAHVA